MAKGYNTGDRICENCGDTNVVWYTDNETWNTLHPGGGGILCPRCFIAIYDAIEGEQCWYISTASMDRQPE